MSRLSQPTATIGQKQNVLLADQLWPAFTRGIKLILTKNEGARVATTLSINFKTLKGS